MWLTLRPELALHLVPCDCNTGPAFAACVSARQSLQGRVVKKCECCCRVVDFGSIYASKTFKLKDGRRVLLGWAYETAAGCESECSTGTNFTNSLVSSSLNS